MTVATGTYGLFVNSNWAVYPSQSIVQANNTIAAGSSANWFFQNHPDDKYTIYNSENGYLGSKDGKTVSTFPYVTGDEGTSWTILQQPSGDVHITVPGTNGTKFVGLPAKSPSSTGPSELSVITNESSTTYSLQDYKGAEFTLILEICQSPLCAGETTYASSQLSAPTSV